MRLEDIQNVTSIPWRPIPDDVIEFLWELHEGERDPEGLSEAQRHERWLEEEIERVRKHDKSPKDDLIYVALGNACCRDDYLRLIARYGTPANRDFDYDAVREYEALCEAVYRVGALLAFGEGFGEFEDIEQIVEMEKRHPVHEMDFTLPASVDLIVRIPDYRRAIMPREVRVEDINEVYWPPMFNPVRNYTWRKPMCQWAATGLIDQPDGGMRKYRMTVIADNPNLGPKLDSDTLRYFCRALAIEIANEQVRDMQLTFYEGEVDLFDPLSACDPPIWRLVWLALCMAKGKTVPSICRSCGKLIDRRAERRNKTVSCTERTRSCTAAFNNNGKKRMIKRKEWGRLFLSDELFDYIAEYRDAVHRELASQKTNPDWPPSFVAGQ